MLFERSRNPMLLADDDRMYRDANDAACALLRTPREQLLRLRVDDFTPPGARDQVDELWRAFIAAGSQSGEFELWLPGGEPLRCEYSATANVLPGLHLSIFLTPVPLVGNGGGAAAEASRAGLTPREREVLELVALGATTDEIAQRLVIGEETARTHVKHALAKLGARTRAQGVAAAIKSGELAL